MTDTVRLVASCQLGLEFVVLKELNHKRPGCSPRARPGGVLFDCPLADVAALKLSSPEGLYALVAEAEGLPTQDADGAWFSETPPPAETWLKAAVDASLDTGGRFEAALRAWRAAFAELGEQPAGFSARAVRYGNHSYRRQAIERAVGGQVNVRTGWKVNLHAPELLLYVECRIESLESGKGQLGGGAHQSEGRSTLLLCIALRTQTQNAARRAALKPSLTPLRRSTCYALLSLADPQPGDVVLDSMAGCAGISIEGAESFPSCFHIAAELSMSDCLNSRHNIRALRASAADVWNSDARYLPLKDGSVDAVIVDLPFGNRHGSHAQNTSLYPTAFREMARVVAPGTGRAVVLTADKCTAEAALALASRWWERVSTHNVQIGGGIKNHKHGAGKKGMQAAVYVLRRTGADGSRATGGALANASGKGGRSKDAKSLRRAKQKQKQESTCRHCSPRCSGTCAASKNNKRQKAQEVQKTAE